MNITPPNRPSKEEKFAYLLGVLTTSIMVALILSTAYYWPSQYKGLYSKAFEPVIELPSDVLEELTQVKAVIENAGNPIHQQQHNTILVHPDKEFKYRLRPETSITGYFLKTVKPYNFDPPVLLLKKETQLSDKAQNYIKSHSQLSFSYTTDKDGFRVTVPKIEAVKKWLLVGDSVAFGVGVDDASTVASQLQDFVGANYEIVNAGVGGYNKNQIYLTAKKLSIEKNFDGLICFFSLDDYLHSNRWKNRTKKILDRYLWLQNNFKHKIIIVFHTKMEYALPDFFLTDERVKNMKYVDQLCSSLPQMCRERKFAFLDWTQILAEYREETKSIFSPFALYVDHCHLSKLGNKLIAFELSQIILANDK